MNKILHPPNNEINYLEADINYTIFHLNDGKKIISAFTLKKYETDYRHAGFLRVSKSFLLNPEFVKSIEKEGRKVTVLMQNGAKMLVSRRKMFLISDFL